MRNLAAALFRLERARSEDDYARVIRHLIEWLSGDEHERVRRSFELWLRRRLRTHLPAATMDDSGPAATLEEIETMFPDLLIREERKRARKEGRAEGRAVGLQEGRQEGLQEGRQEGRLEGELRGVQDGERRAARVALLHLLERRFGSVTPEIRGRIDSADYDALRRWFDHAIDADRIGQVFSERPDVQSGT